MWKTNCNFEKFQKDVNPLYTVGATSEMIFKTMFPIPSVVGITGVEISQKPKCAKPTAIFKTFKTL